MATQATPPEVTAAEERGLAAALNLVPRLLASKSHVLLLVGLFVWLIPLGLTYPGLAPDRVQLIVGNYTNVTSALGACIAAGGTLATHAKQAQHGKLLAELHRTVHGSSATLPAGGPGAQDPATSGDAVPAPTPISGPPSPRWNAE